ncbi:MAG: transglycosylase SLT domain-containing protein [Paracoccaceae bacterium]|nr:transglycosylase SLT domain-containing protein [Paracoccaceae bacterium]
MKNKVNLIVSWLFWSFCLVLLGPNLASAQSVPNCEALAAEIGAAAGLPQGLLPAISRIEAGRGKGKSRRAWPWTLNHAGKGLYFDTEAEALAYAKKATAKGPANLDFGCMQINHRWHGKSFVSLSAMMNPRTNISYAAQFLRELHDRHGSWAAAVRNYHSSDAVRGRGYEQAFVAAHKLMQKQGPSSGTEMAALEPQPNFTGGDGLRKGGLFGMPLQGASQPLVRVMSNAGAAIVEVQGGEDINALYDALLALHALRREALDQVESPIAPVLLTQLDAAPAELARQWDKVKAFRQALSQP